MTEQPLITRRSLPDRIRYFAQKLTERAAADGDMELGGLAIALGMVANDAEAEAQNLRRALPAIRRALEQLPSRCRYHGDKTDPDQYGYRREACCDTGIPTQRRKLAEAALNALQEPTP